MGLMDFDLDTHVVMTDGGSTIIQSQSAAGQSDGTRLSFQTYGGWLTNSVFGVEVLRVIEDGTTTPRYAYFSFGTETGSNPTEAFLQWTGVMVGTDTAMGDVSVQYTDSNPNLLDFIIFSHIRNLSSGGRYPVVGGADRLQIDNIPLTNGSFGDYS